MKHVRRLIGCYRRVTYNTPTLPFCFCRVPTFGKTFLSVMTFLRTMSNHVPGFTNVGCAFRDLCRCGRYHLCGGNGFSVLRNRSRAVLPYLTVNNTRNNVNKAAGCGNGRLANVVRT